MWNMTEMPTFIPTTSVEIKEAPCFVGDSVATRTGRLVIYAAIMLVSLTANVLVILIVCRDKRMRKPINYFIVNMCSSDLLITLVYMPRTVSIFAVGYEWLVTGLAGLATCKIVPFLLETATTVSILTVVVISLDRFLSVLFPLRTIITSRPARAIIFAMWIISAAFRSPIFYIKLVERNGKTFCTLDLDAEIYKGAASVYYKVVMATLYILPLLLIVLFYSGIIFVLKRKNAAIRLFRRDGGRAAAKNQQVLRMVMVVVAVFFCCWILYFVVLVLDTMKVIVSCEVRFARLILAHSNCAITPCLYFIFSENFRRGFASIRNSYTTRRVTIRGKHSASHGAVLTDEKKNGYKNSRGFYNMFPNGNVEEPKAVDTFEMEGPPMS